MMAPPNRMTVAITTGKKVFTCHWRKNGQKSWFSVDLKKKGPSIKWLFSKICF